MIKGFPSAVLCATLLIAAGCSSGSEEQAKVIGPDSSAPSAEGSAATASSSAAPTTSSSPSRSVTPTSAEQLDEETRRQLLATPVAYYEAIERSYTTLDFSEVERLSSKDCGSCQAQLAFLQKAARQRYQIVGGHYMITDARLGGPLSGKRWGLFLKLANSEMEIKDSSGKTLQSLPALSAERQQVDLTWERDRWVVYRVHRLA